MAEGGSRLPDDGEVFFFHDADPERRWPAIRLGVHHSWGCTPIVTQKVAESVLGARQVPFTVTADSVILVEDPEGVITLAPNELGEYDLAPLAFVFDTDEQ
ncbi:Uncharacterised protein [Mycobacteroides abscessus subsp. abscessus]|uniref:hypothetical protein n=1 Tax=Mycobacteroides abscessus TaxID=36809 RepID=UPI00092A2102|nr:hypothetical protein [Mycobacteroides abscessus]SIH36616.1 Uncharacterised protein [Mycobacteroides abscessus subsp. abscessus]